MSESATITKEAKPRGKGTSQPSAPTTTQGTQGSSNGTTSAAPSTLPSQAPGQESTSNWKRKKGTEKESKTEYDGVRTTSETERKAQAGLSYSNEDSTDTFDGKVAKQTEVKHEAFVGAEAAVKTIKSATDAEIKYAVETMARAGAFGESSRKAMIQRGALKAGAEGSAKGGAGVEVKSKTELVISQDLYNALSLVIEAGAKAGVEGELSGRLMAGLGPLGVSIGAKISGFAGALAEAKADVSAGLTHFYASGEASAFAGAKADGEADVTVKLGEAEAKAAIEGSAMAGASAEAKGSFKIDLTGVELTGKAEAFAGVKAEASAKGTVAYKGRTVFSAKGTVGVQAGVGGEAEGGFSFRQGKLTIKGEVAGTLGIGAKVGLELEIDFYALALMVENMIVTAFLEKKEEINREAPKVQRVPIIDSTKAVAKRKAGYEAYINDFKAYNAKVYGKSKEHETGIMRDRVQSILDNRWHKNKDNWQFLEFDEGVVQAAKDAFGSNLKDIGVQAGQLRWFDVKRTRAQQDKLNEKLRKNLGGKSWWQIF